MNEKNLFKHNSLLSSKDREDQFGHKNLCLWFTGLSGSGKSSIAYQVEKELFNRGVKVFVLDGDNVRHGLNKDLGFSQKDRSENIRRIGETAKLFVDAGLIILTAFISPYKRDRENARNLFKDKEFIEVYLEADILACEKRDKKGIYKKAKQGLIKEFTGISAPYEVPENPEIKINTVQESDVSINTKKIIHFLEIKGYIKPCII